MLRFATFALYFSITVIILLQGLYNQIKTKIKHILKLKTCTDIFIF